MRFKLSLETNEPRLSSASRHKDMRRETGRGRQTTPSRGRTLVLTTTVLHTVGLYKLKSSRTHGQRWRTMNGRRSVQYMWNSNGPTAASRTTCTLHLLPLFDNTSQRLLDSSFCTPENLLVRFFLCITNIFLPSKSIPTWSIQVHESVKLKYKTQ